jgi:hypothetical protein
MDALTRRAAIGATAGFGAAAIASCLPTAAGQEPPAGATESQESVAALDRKRVLECGFTEAEADCWQQLNQTAAMFFALPKLHAMDDHELAHAIHVLQYRLMSRPTYRQYTAVAQRDGAVPPTAEITEE